MTSARTATRLTRILAMLPWVIANPGATADEVCARFGYDDRGELVEDLNMVFVCGLPGYGPGELMDAYLDEDEVVVDMADYFARSPRLSPAEALALLAAGMALLSAGHGPPALRSGVEKLQRALVPDAGDTLVVDIAEEPGLVGVVRDAAAAGRVVHIAYTSLRTGQTTEREIEPWAVFSTLGNWYVTAHCRLAGGERAFRVDLIREATLTGDSFERPAQAPPPEIRYTPAPDDLQATIRLGPRARWVAEYYPVEVVDDDGEQITVVFRASDPAVAGRLLLRLGADAELVDGAEAGAALAELRRAILARYHPDD